jgi:hypothetical protein
MSDEQVFGSDHVEHRPDKPKLRLQLVGPDARLWLRLLLRAKLWLL